MSQTVQPKTYKIVDILNRGESYHADIPDRKIEFVTLALREQENTNLFKQGGNTDPFVVITGRSAANQAAIDKIKECIDDNGKFDPSKLNGQDEIRGKFARWPAPWHWQTYRDEDGKTRFRKYRKGHPDEGHKIPSRAVTMFIWEQDLQDWQGVIASSIPSGALIISDDEEVQNYRYQSPFAAEMMKKIKGSNTQDTEESAAPTADAQDDLVQ